MERILNTTSRLVRKSKISNPLHQKPDSSWACSLQSPHGSIIGKLLEVRLIHNNASIRKRYHATPEQPLWAGVPLYQIRDFSVSSAMSQKYPEVLAPDSPSNDGYGTVRNKTTNSTIPHAAPSFYV